MNQNKEKKNKNIQVLDELDKNEEDLLAYTSKYNTNLYNEEDLKENEIEIKNAKKRLSSDSTSFSISQEYSNISGCNLKKTNTISKKDEISFGSIGYEDTINYTDSQIKKRKMSSPLYFYYDGLDIFLSKRHKNTVDMNNSQNFIKKERYFNNSGKMINIKKLMNNTNNNNIKKNNSPDINPISQNINFINNNNKINNSNNNYINNKNERKLSMNINKIDYNINNINNIYELQNNNFIANNIFLQNNNYQRPIYNINYININNPVNSIINKRKLSYNTEEGTTLNYFNNLLNLNNNLINPNQSILNLQPQPSKLNHMLFSYSNPQEKNISQFNNNNNFNNESHHNNSKNKKKPLDKRKGDWICPKCKNLNFSFRVVCNRCQLPKPSNLMTLNEQ